MISKYLEGVISALHTLSIWSCEDMEDFGLRHVFYFFLCLVLFLLMYKTEREILLEDTYLAIKKIEAERNK